MVSEQTRAFPELQFGDEVDIEGNRYVVGDELTEGDRVELLAVISREIGGRLAGEVVRDQPFWDDPPQLDPIAEVSFISGSVLGNARVLFRGDEIMGILIQYLGENMNQCIIIGINGRTVREIESIYRATLSSNSGYNVVTIVQTVDPIGWGLVTCEDHPTGHTY